MLCEENEYKEENTIDERTLPIHKETEEKKEKKEGGSVENHEMMHEIKTHNENDCQKEKYMILWNILF